MGGGIEKWVAGTPGKPVGGKFSRRLGLGSSQERKAVCTIKRAPKGGGGTATILAYDTNPTAIAVDATSIYWTDMGGYIKSIPK